MSEPTTKTLDGSAIRAFGGWTQAPERALSERPRLRVLHHVDLARIGACSLADAELEAGGWRTVGRAEPLFVEPGPEGWERPLDDASISRRQLRVRFVAERRVFVVEPHPEGKRRLGVWTPGAGIQELPRTMEVPEGAAIAIEDRALIGLELASKTRGPEEDRAGLIGESEAAWRLREQIADAARFAHPVLVLGETGSGKERVAQAIHQKSPRREQPLVVVNCAALPEALAESLLFGHVKGAFTGAGADRDGVFRAAHGGTLFLDELGEMPASVQPKLLRTLQDGLVMPVGRHDAVSVDVRVIAATNRDPERAMAEGRLREDLYHRLAGHVIRLPSLAARRFDVPELFVRFVASLQEGHAGPDWLFGGGALGRPSVPLEFVRWLLEQPWSGNVRELRNVAELCARKNVDATTFQVPEGLSVIAAPAEAPRPAVAANASPAPLPADREHLAAASRALGLAHKTVAKLFGGEDLSSLVTGAPGELESRLEAAAAERLLACLEQHDFEQRALAVELDCSPSTLVKLMQRFRIPRALDLDESAVQAAIDAAGGDVEAAARSLRVSAQGLKKRLVLLRLRS